MEAPRGSLTAVIGHVGSGKSSLLSALLGELEPVENPVGSGYGSVSTAERIGYVPQRAFVLSGTVEENIRLGLPEDKP